MVSQPGYHTNTIDILLNISQMQPENEVQTFNRL